MGPLKWSALFVSFVARRGAALTVAVAVLVVLGYKEMGGSMMFR